MWGTKPHPKTLHGETGKRTAGYSRRPGIDRINAPLSITQTVHIGREPVGLLVDTGAEISCLNKTTYNRIKQAVGPLQQPEIQYFAADGQKLRMEGIIKNAEINWKGKKFQLNLLVLADIAQADGIAGMDMLQAADAYISCKNMQVTNGTTPPVAAVKEKKYPR